MTLTLTKAFAAHGLRAYVNGEPGMVLPMSEEIHGAIAADELAKTGKTVSAGQLIVMANRKGEVLNMGARNDIRLAITRKDGTEDLIGGAYGNYDRVADAHAVIALKREAKRDAKNVVRENERIAKEYASAIQRGETPEEPTYREPKFADDAFDKVVAYVSAVETYLANTIEHSFDVEAKSNALDGLSRLKGAQKNVLDAEDLAKAREARELRQRIGELNPNHADAVKPAATAYQADDAGVAASDAVDTLSIEGQGFSDRQMSMLRANPTLCNEVFSVLTTTPPGRLTARKLDHADFETAEQELGRFEEMAWSKTALDGIVEVLKDRMPGYNFKAKIYEVEGADVMLMRDDVGAYLYAWDSASRVAEINVKDEVLYTFTEKDVPSEDELDALRRQVHDMTFEVPDEISFG